MRGLRHWPCASNVQRTEPAWRGALNWQFLSNQALRYAYARSFRIPSLIETEIFWTGSFSFGRRDESQSAYPMSLPLPPVRDPIRLKPETIEAHSVGYFGAFFRSSATVDLKVFSESIHDPIEASLFYFSPQPFNASPFTIKGVEMDAAYRISDRWKVSGQYSYLDNTTRDPVERGLQSLSAGSALITYRPAPGHRFSVGYYGNSDMSGHSYSRTDFVYNYRGVVGVVLLG
jgi:iron complex outermembrane recepter protein